MEDAKIVELFFARSEDAVSETEKKYGRYCHYIAGQVLSSDEDAREIVNDTWLRLWNTIPPENPAPLTAYACRIARNLALKRLREKTAQKRDSRVSLPLEELAEVLPAPSAEEQWDANALAQAVDAWLEGLKETDRVLFVRRYWFGDSVQEAAQRVGLRENTASVRLRRMKLRLRDYLTQEGYMV